MTVSKILSVLFVGVLRKRAQLFGVHIRAPDFPKLPDSSSLSFWGTFGCSSLRFGSPAVQVHVHEVVVNRCADDAGAMT